MAWERFYTKGVTAGVRPEAGVGDNTNTRLIEWLSTGKWKRIVTPNASDFFLIPFMQENDGRRGRAKLGDGHRKNKVTALGR